MAKKKAVSKQKLPSSKLVIGIFVVALVILVGATWTRHAMAPAPSSPSVSSSPMPFDFDNQMFTFDGATLYFINGEFTGAADAMAGHTAYMTNRTVNPSGTKAAAIAIDNPGGSGSFYYLIGSSLDKGKEVYSTPVLFGDRIMVLSITVGDDGIIWVNYLDHAKNAPMVADPTQHKTAKYAFQEDGNLISVLH